MTHQSQALDCIHVPRESRISIAEGFGNFLRILQAVPSRQVCEHSISAEGAVGTVFNQARKTFQRFTKPFTQCQVVDIAIDRTHRNANSLASALCADWLMNAGEIDLPRRCCWAIGYCARCQPCHVRWFSLLLDRGTMFPDWRGNLLVPALKERAVRRVLRNGRQVVGQQLLLADLKARMRDVKVAPDGSIYVLTDGPDARLLRIVEP